MLRKSFLSLHDFWVKYCKNKLFEENKGIEIEVQVITNPSIDLKENQTLEILLMNVFYDLKKASFPAFSDIFENHYHYYYYYYYYYLHCYYY